MSDDLCGPLLCFLDGSDLGFNPAHERSYVLSVLVDHDQLPLVVIGLELGDPIQLVIEGGLELLDDGLAFDELRGELRDVLLSFFLRELAGLNLDGHQVGSHGGYRRLVVLQHRFQMPDLFVQMENLSVLVFGKLLVLLGDVNNHVLDLLSDG